MDVTSRLRLFRATAGMRFFTQEGPLQLIAPVGIGVEFVALCHVRGSSQSQRFRRRPWMKWRRSSCGAPRSQGEE